MPLKIEEQLLENEEILFKGTYNVNNINQTGPSITTIETLIEKNPNAYNLLVDNYYNT